MPCQLDHHHLNASDSLIIEVMNESMGMKNRSKTVKLNGYFHIRWRLLVPDMNKAILSSFLAQLSRCAYAITFRKPYIASLEIWMIGLFTVGPFDYNIIQMDDYPADSCAISPMAFLLLMHALIHLPDTVSVVPWTLKDQSVRV